MEKASKVLFINPWDRLIGPNRYLAEILRGTPELAGRSTVVFHEANDALGEYRDAGCDVAVWPEVGLIHPRVTVSNLSRLTATHSLGLARVTARVRASKARLVITNTEIVTIGGVAARILGIPHVQIVHSLLFRYRWRRFSPATKLYFKWLSSFARCFVAVSEAVRQMLLEYGVRADKIGVIPNGFDVLGVRDKSRLPLPVDVQNLIRGRFPVLVSIGRIAPMKGQDLLVEAVDRLRETYPSMVCLLAGRTGSKEGVEDAEAFQHALSDQIARHQLEKNIYFLGEVDYVPALLSASDLYVHPSLTESFSRVVAEALICGKPVVCSSAGALPEVAGPRGALYVPPGDAGALTGGVLRVLRDEAFRREAVSSGASHVESHYPVSQTAQGLLALLNTAAGKEF